MEEIFKNISFAIAGITTLVGAVYYLKYTASKANIDGKNETIETQGQQLEAYKEEVDRQKLLAEGYKKQAEAFKDAAQQTPQLIELTKAITRLTTTIEEHHKQNVGEKKQTAKILQQVVQSLKGARTNAKRPAK